MKKREFLKLASLFPLACDKPPFLSSLSHLFLPPEQQNDEPHIFPDFGWIETSLPNRPPFITLEGNPKGHEAFLKYVIDQQPTVNLAFKQITRAFFEEPVKNPPLQNVINDHLQAATEALTKLHPLTFSSLSPSAKKFHALSVASYTLAGLFSNYYSFPELSEMLNITIPKEIDKGTFPNIIDMYPFFPAVLPANQSDTPDNIDDLDKLSRYSGKDGAMHFFNHFFLTWQWLSFHLSQSPDLEHIPSFIQSLIKDTDHYQEALKLSLYAGLGYEVISTPHPLAAETDQGTINIPQGFQDPRVFNDILANLYGADFAARLFHRLVSDQNPDLSEFYPWLDSLSKPPSTQTTAP